MARKFTATFDDKLLEKVDSVSSDMGLTRSAFLAVAVNSYFQQTDALQVMNNMPHIIAKLEELDKKIDESKTK